MLEPSHFQAGRRNLIAVLDWGLGHASRSLALAQRLRAAGEEVAWASAGPALEMIQTEVEGEKTYELPAYNIRYQSSNMYWNIARQLPKIQRVIRAEKQAIQAIIESSTADRLISDSRFGCYSHAIPSIFLSHQLQPIIPQAARWIYHHYLRKFSAYWVPDLAATSRLSGRLSSPGRFEEVHYLGYLSRLSASPAKHQDNTIKKWRIGVLLSGPEPQRTLLEQQLMKLLQEIPGEHHLIRGLAGGKKLEKQNNVLVRDYADAVTICQLFQSSDLIVARSGYSSLMDMQTQNVQQALLIPTPGQTEQIYLARRAAQQGWASMISQSQLDKATLLEILDQVSASS